MRVVVVAEYYPRAADPVLGVWAHRQALAARDAGADVRVLVLHRPVPSKAALRSRAPQQLLEPLRQPLHARARRHRRHLRAVRRAAAPALLRPLGRVGGADPRARAAADLQRSFPFDLVHAHYAAPAGDAVRRARPGVPVVVSVHGGDVLSVVRRRGGHTAVTARTRRRPGSCSPTPPASRRARGARGGSTRASCTSARTSRPEPARARSCRRSPPSAISSRASATPTCCGRCGCCATRTPTCAGSWPATARSARGSSSSHASSQMGGRVKLLGQLPPAEARRGGAGGDRVRAAERRRGVRGRLHRGDGGRRAGDRLPRRGRAGGDRRQRAGDPARRARRSRGRWRRSCARCSTTPPGAASSATAPARRSSARSPGRPAGARRSPPTRRRCGEPARSCSSPTTRRRSGSGRSRSCTSART